jgi:ribosomal protein RSM22 (predicted rRNA methylase)
MRLPGTFAAVFSSLDASMMRALARRPLRLLDAFAGPATALLAAKAAGFEIETAVCVERSQAMIEMGRRLIEGSCRGATIEWANAELGRFLERDTRRFDVVVVSYGLGEVDSSTQRKSILRALWERVDEVLLVVEPGTSAGGEVIQSARTWLAEFGGHIVAPCPHRNSCGYAALGSGWCHFSVRIGRTHLTRVVDGATVGYEDEKFCYVAVGRTAASDWLCGRIVGHPRISQAGIQLDVCLPSGEVRRVMIPKRRKTAYRAARKLRWGDVLPFELCAAFAEPTAAE